MQILLLSSEQAELMLQFDQCHSVMKNLQALSIRTSALGVRENHKEKGSLPIYVIFFSSVRLVCVFNTVYLQAW